MTDKKKIQKSKIDMYMEFWWIIEKWEKREVWWIASTEVIDSTWDIVSYNAIKNAWGAYMEFWNIREMHQPKAVWTIIDYKLDDKSKTTFIRVKVVDDSAWEKVKEWVYKGFSIWWSIEDAAFEIVDWKEVFVIKWITLAEISLVDHPANPEAKVEWYKFLKLNSNDMKLKERLSKFFKWEITEEELSKAEEIKENEEKETKEKEDKETKWEDKETEWKAEWEEDKEEEWEKKEEWEEDKEIKETETEKSTEMLDLIKTLVNEVKDLKTEIEFVKSTQDKFSKWLIMVGDEITKWAMVNGKIDNIEKTLKDLLKRKAPSIQKDIVNTTSTNWEVSLREVIFGK